jgi:hypothetical protein
MTIILQEISKEERPFEAAGSVSVEAKCISHVMDSSSMKASFPSNTTCGGDSRHMDNSPEQQQLLALRFLMKQALQLMDVRGFVGIKDSNG